VVIVADIDECINPSLCESGTRCVDLFGSYRCECKHGFRRFPDGSCYGL